MYWSKSLIFFQFKIVNFALGLTTYVLSNIKILYQFKGNPPSNSLLNLFTTTAAAALPQINLGSIRFLTLYFQVNSFDYNRDFKKTIKLEFWQVFLNKLERLVNKMWIRNNYGMSNKKNDHFGNIWIAIVKMELIFIED